MATDGGFYCTLGQHEKKGGQVSSRQSHPTELESLLTSIDTQTQDPGYVGIPFTWSNNRSPPKCILERLDKCLGNEAWGRLYWSLTVHHLTRLNSDHCPLLLIEGTMLNTRPHKFRFEKYVDTAARFSWHCQTCMAWDIWDSGRTIWQTQVFGSYTLWLEKSFLCFNFGGFKEARKKDQGDPIEWCISQFHIPFKSRIWPQTRILS